MNDIKNIVAKNISELRQAAGITQIELAEKLNYTDKAVSKWERGESLPDVSVLVELADLFGVSLDFLVRKEHGRGEARRELRHKHKYNRGIITCVALLLVWFIAMFCYVTLSWSLPSAEKSWLCFIYALPVMAVVWLVLNSIWFNSRWNYLIISLLMWSGLLAVHLTCLQFSVNVWQIYLLGIPGQLTLLLWTGIKKRR